jgi:hypothetical protein
MEFKFLGIEKNRFSHIANFGIMLSDIIISVSNESDKVITRYSTSSNNSRGITLSEIEAIETLFQSWLYSDNLSLSKLREVGIL